MQTPRQTAAVQVLRSTRFVEEIAHARTGPHNFNKRTLRSAWHCSGAGCCRRSHRDAFDADDRLIVGAVRYDSDANTEWSKNLPAGRPVILYCAHGAEVSQTAAAELHEV